MAERTLTELIEGAKAGSHQDLDALVERLGNLVWSVVRSFRLPNEDALDAAQMTWLRFVESIANIHDPERVGLWLATTARRESMKSIERSKRSMPVDPHGAFRTLETPSDEYAGVDNRDLANQVLDAVEALQEPCRQLLRMLLCDPAPSYEEVSRALVIPVGTIGPRRARCLQRLRSIAGV